MLQKHDTTKKLQVHIYSGSKTVGAVRGNTFNKTVMGSRHFLRKPQAIAISCDALEQAEQAGATRLRVIDRETGIIYTATIEHFRTAGFTLNRGFGPQIALPLAGWVRSRKGGELEQLSLFEGVPA